MKHITFYLDFVCPYAYLAFEHLPQALEGVSYSVSYQPVLFAEVLEHHGQRGQTDVASQRDWICRQVPWLARHLGIQLQMPAHPALHPYDAFKAFNPLPLLHLALACSGNTDAATGHPNRHICEAVFRHVWRGGAQAGDTQQLQALGQQLAPHLNMHNPADVARVNLQLKRNTQNAITKGVFSVPSFAVDEQLFCGLDALPMLRDALNTHA